MIESNSSEPGGAFVSYKFGKKGERGLFDKCGYSIKAPIGGKDCELCNDFKECTEYLCYQ